MRGRLFVGVLIGCACLSAAACKGPVGADPGVQKEPVVTVDPMETLRPGWWIDEPVRDGGTVSIAAYAEDPDLARARTLAVSAASMKFKEVTGIDPVHPLTKTDSVSLQNGLFRAFVRLTAKGS